MAQNETWLKHDLLEAVKVQYLDGNLFSMDNAGNLIGVTLTRDGEDYSGGGSVSANVIRSDGGTVAVSGALSGKTATVVLPQAAYAVPGVVSIIVKLTASGQVTTIAALVANVYRSSTDTAVDPGTIIPSIQTLISQINTAVASIPADYSALWTKLAPAFSTDASYVAGQYVTYNSGLYRFNTSHSGSWSSSDVTAVNLGGEITELKSALKKHPLGYIDFVDDEKMPDSGVLSQNYTGGTYKFVRKDITLPSGTYILVLYDCLFSSVGVFAVEKTLTYADVVNATTPGIYYFSLQNETNLIIRMQISNSSSVSENTYHCSYSIYKNEPLLPKGIIESDFKYNKFTAGYLNPDTGLPYYSVVDGQFGFCMTDMIRCPNSANIHMISPTLTNQYIKAISFFAEDGSYISSIGQTQSTEYNGTAPNNAYSMIACFQFTATNTKEITNKNFLSINGISILNSIHSIDSATKNISTFNSRLTTVESEIDHISNYKAKSQFAKSNTLASGGSLSLSVPNLKQNNRIAFYAEIVSPFTEIQISHGTNQVWASGYIVLSQSTLKAYKYESSAIETESFNHGLTLDEYVYVIIDVKNQTNATVTIMTKNGSSYTNDITWFGCYGNASALLNGGSLKNCALSFYSMDYRKDVWAYGDSYFDFWPTYVNAAGANNWLADAFSGRNATQAYASFEKDMLHGTPRYVLWCMGMNNADSSEAINSDWKTITDNLISYCDNAGIEIILVTIPNTPIRNHNYKNAYIRNSGKRYVDISQAVGAEESTSWYTGLLSSDNVHPTQNGAKVIANRMMASVPELFA